VKATDEFEQYESFAFSDYFNKILLESKSLRATLTAGQIRVHSEQHRHIGHSRLYEGLWPGRILMDSRLSDKGSSSFLRVMRVFLVAFGLVHTIILIGLAYATFQVGSRAFYPATPPQYAVPYQNESYIRVGDGFCRDVAGLRPDGYYKILSLDHVSAQRPSRGLRKTLFQRRVALALLENSPRGPLSDLWKYAADLCSDHLNCIGFSTANKDSSQSLTGLYFKGYVDAPDGWVDFVEDITGGSATYNASRIATSDGNIDYACWRKFQSSRHYPEIAAACVYLLHALAVIHVVWSVMRKILKLDTSSITNLLSDSFKGS